jgi:hypothetical protein
MDIIQRAKNILLQPAQEWPVIEKEQGSILDIYTSYIVPLAAIGPAASIIGFSIFGFSTPFAGTIRVPIGSAIGHAVVTYVLSLVGIYVLAMIINSLAPTFLATKNDMQALKVAAYSSTASWLAGAFNLIPALSFLQILGLYSLYLLYLGLPVLMKAPEEKAIGFTVAVVIAAIVIFAVVGALGRALFF